MEAEGLVNFGEIFHPEPLPGARGSFREFATANDFRLVDVRSSSGLTDIAQRYLAWLIRQAAARHFLIDVKLNAWLALSGWWQYPTREPFFLQQLKRECAIFIFVWRESLGDQVLSHFISNKLGIWHNLSAAKVAGRTLQAPVGRLKSLAATILRAEAEMHDHLRNYRSKIVIRYEDLFEAGVLTSQFRRAFRQVARFDLPLAQPGIHPNSVPKREIIENYDEVMAAIAPLARQRHLPSS